jgi:hypothetical protein
VRHADEHPDDAALIHRCLEAMGENAAVELHLADCSHCAARHRAIAAALRENDPDWVSEGASALAEPALERQRQEILRRLTPNRLADVIPFPTPSLAPTRLRSGWRSRLAAVSAIVAIVGAAGAGWMIETQRRDVVRLRTEKAQNRGVRSLPQPGQDLLLSDIDLALASSAPPALRALDAFTPTPADAADRR